MPGSSAAAQRVERLLEHWLEAARAQRSGRRLGREPEQPARPRLGKKDIEFPAETRLSFTTRAAATIN
jgi:hypothetical protein